MTSSIKEFLKSYSVRNLLKKYDYDNDYIINIDCINISVTETDDNKDKVINSWVSHDDAIDSLVELIWNECSDISMLKMKDDERGEWNYNLKSMIEGIVRSLIYNDRFIEICRKEKII